MDCDISFHMFRVSRIVLVIAVAVATVLPLVAQRVAATPPMGWNSWDAYGLTIDEADYKANAQVLAGLKEYGWNYSVIDEGWFLENPLEADKPETLKYTLDAYGRTVPAPNRFPSAADGAGFKAVADYTHSHWG